MSTEGSSKKVTVGLFLRKRGDGAFVAILIVFIKGFN